MLNRRSLISLTISVFIGAALGTVALSEAQAMTPALSAQILPVISVVSFGVLAITVALMGHRIAASAAMAVAILAGVHHITHPVGQFAAGQALASLNNGGTASVARQYDGHFRAATLVNGRPVEMLVDTGASLVLLTWEDAEAAGIDMDALRFDAPILTANGRSHVAVLDLDTVTIDGVGAANVRGAVAKPGMLHASLLGMSFLGAIEEAAIRKNEMILKN